MRSRPQWLNWLIQPDPNPGFTTGKLLKLLVRVLLFALIATLLSSLLSFTPLGPYLKTWWGSLLFILLLYIPVARYMVMDGFAPRRGASRGQTGTSGAGAKNAAGLTSAQRRKERNRYAGVRKSAPKYGGRR